MKLSLVRLRLLNEPDDVAVRVQANILIVNLEAKIIGCVGRKIYTRQLAKRSLCFGNILNGIANGSDTFIYEKLPFCKLMEYGLFAVLS